MDIEKASRRKKYFFRKAQERIEKAGLSSKIKVEERSIGVLNGKVKVFIKPIPVKKNKKIWEQAKCMEDFHEVPFKKTLFETKRDDYKGYFMF